MDGRSLPGFYYDAEKKKYFKVNPNHKSGSDAPYSASSVNVKKRKAQESSQRKQYATEKLQQTVNRSRLHRNPFITASLHRELGLTRRRDLCLARDKCLLMGFTSIGRRYIPDFSAIRDTTAILEYAADPVTHGHIILSRESAGIFVVDVHNDKQDKYCMGPSDVLPSFSSLSISPGRLWTVTSYHRHVYGNMAIGRIRDDPEASGNEFMFYTLGPEDMTLWGAEPQPAAESTLLAIGTSDGLVLLDQVHNREPPSIKSSLSGVHCVDWLTENVVMCGTRNGVVLCDIRAQDTRLRFPSEHMVLGLRNMGNQTQLVTSDSAAIRLYDVRRPPSTYSTGTAKPFEQSVLEMPPNQQIYWTDFDVWGAGRMLARPCGAYKSSTTHSVIEFRSLLDGSIMYNKRAEGNSARAVRFLDHREVGMTLSYASPDAIHTLSHLDISPS